MSQEIEAPNARIDSLFARAQSGDKAAWDELVTLSYDRIRRVVSRRLAQPMRTIYDSTDITNDVFKSFVAKSSGYNFATFDALYCFLRENAQRKLIDERRKQYRLKRNLDATSRLEALRGEDGGAFEPTASDPTPSQFAQAHDTREQLLAGQSEAERELIELKATNLTNEELAELKGQNVRKVQRFFKKLHDSWVTFGG
jgi:DNA-directed RNA polymerase specialized sigma24 family protein